MLVEVAFEQCRILVVPDSDPLEVLELPVEIYSVGLGLSMMGMLLPAPHPLVHLAP